MKGCQVLLFNSYMKSCGIFRLARTKKIKCNEVSVVVSCYCGRVQSQNYVIQKIEKKRNDTHTTTQWFTAASLHNEVVSLQSRSLQVLSLQRRYAVSCFATS